MKKLFTTILMMGVALCSWATITPDWKGNGTLILTSETGDQFSTWWNSVKDANPAPEWKGNVTTLKLEGPGFVNSDFTQDAMKNFIIAAGGNKTIHLDLGGCTGLISKVTWTGDAEDIGLRHLEVTGGFTFGQDNNSLGYYIKALTFPNSNNFTAIPTELCQDRNFPYLENVYFENTKIEYIGGKAFYQRESETVKNSDETKRPKLNNVTFPQSLKVIGTDAFYGCTKFTKVDLGSLPNLVRVDAAAFNMVDIAYNNLSNVILPTKDNNALKFWGNQVFSSSHVVTLDFSHCLGIKNFAYDGKNSMGEQSYTPGGERQGGKSTFTWHAYLTTLILPPNITYISGGNASDGITVSCPRLTTVTFTGKAKYDDNCNLLNPLVIDKQAFLYQYDGMFQTDEFLPSISDPKGNSQHRLLKYVTLSDNVTFIGQLAFARTSIETIHIPASVETIEQQAFEACRALKQVVFDDVDANCKCGETTNKPTGALTTVKSKDENGNGGEGSGAFNNCAGITDVYVNREHLKCENNAFDPAITTARGDNKGSFATLHFPESDMENYTNINHYITNEIAMDAGKFHKWLMQHMDLAKSPKPNGWWEFINAGPMKTNIDEEPTYQSIMLRTFSDYNTSYLVPDGLRAYVVNNVVKNGANFELSLQRLMVIPAKTGVILYGHPNSKNLEGQPILSMTPVKFAPEGKTVLGKTAGPNEGLALCRANWETLRNASPEDFALYKNFLEPTSSNENNDGKHVKPYEKDDDGNVVYRNFAMGRYNKTLYKGASSVLDKNNFVGFFRMVEGDYVGGKAYLRLKNDDFDDATNAVLSESGEILVKEDKGPNNNNVDGYYYERNLDDQNGGLYNARAEVGNPKKNPKGWWDDTKGFTWNEPINSWGLRSNAIPAAQVLKYFGEMEESADGVAKVIIPAENEASEYFTLQGVKVSNPTKGIYVTNGKKVIIK